MAVGWMDYEMVNHRINERIFAGESGMAIPDDTVPGFLQTVEGLGFRDLTSPIMSCGSSFEGERFLQMRAERPAETAAQERKAPAPVPIPDARKRKAKDLDPNHSEVDSGSMGTSLIESEEAPTLGRKQGPEFMWTPEEMLAEREGSSSLLAGTLDDDTSSRIGAKRKEDHNSHTRKSREKLNDKFEHLVSILKACSPGLELKHKAQILDHTLAVLSALVRESKALEMELALTSTENSVRWAQTVIATAENETDAFFPFLELLCLKQRESVGELWRIEHTGRYTLVRSTTSANLAGGVPVARTEERSNDVNLPLQCDSTMRTCMADGATLRTAERRLGHPVVSAVGLPIIYSGRVKLVAVLYNTKAETDPQVVEDAELVATCFGNAYSSKLFKSRTAAV